MSSRWSGLASICACLAIATAHADDSPALEAVKRDLDRYLGCRQYFELDCLLETTYTDLHAAATRLNPYPPERLEELTDTYKSANADPATRLRIFERETPLEPFRAGTQLFTVVPYRWETPSALGWFMRNSYLIGISDDDGATWKFVQAEAVRAKRIHLVIPGYREELLPAVSDETIEAPALARSTYLRTLDAHFEYFGESTAYALTLDVRKRVKSEIALSVYFDDPSLPGRLRSFQSSLAPEQETLQINSPAMRGFEGGKSYDVILVGTDATTGAELVEHHQEMVFGAFGPLTTND